MTTLTEENLTWESVMDPKMKARATLTWKSEDPMAVIIEFLDQHETTWLFGRDLLGDALDRPGVQVGLADVQVVIAIDKIYLTLSSPFGGVKLRTEVGAVERFIRRTYDIVPRDREGEKMDMDEVVAKLLSEPA